MPGFDRWMEQSFGSGPNQTSRDKDMARTQMEAAQVYTQSDCRFLNN